MTALIASCVAVWAVTGILVSCVACTALWDWFKMGGWGR